MRCVESVGESRKQSLSAVAREVRAKGGATVGVGKQPNAQDLQCCLRCRQQVTCVAGDVGDFTPNKVFNGWVQERHCRLMYSDEAIVQLPQGFFKGTRLHARTVCTVSLE